MKLGARMLKTGIAITLALYIAELLNMPSPIFTGIAAIFAIQPTIYRSYLSVVEQVQGNIIGALLAITFYLLFGSHLLIVGLAAIVAIVIMVKLKLENSIRLALVTIIVIMEAPAEQFCTLHLCVHSQYSSVFFQLLLSILFFCRQSMKQSCSKAFLMSPKIY